MEPEGVILQGKNTRPDNRRHQVIVVYNTSKANLQLSVAKYFASVWQMPIANMVKKMPRNRYTGESVAA